jgi:hypothetical protein
MVEGSASGVLNEQRINQASVQAQGFNNNYMGFLTRRAKLWKYYWKTYWKSEDVIRVLEKKDEKDPDWIAINKIVTDEYGNVQVQNSLDDADAYDITFEDSWKSPTMRDKVQKQLSNMMQNGSLQNDPELASEVYSYFLQLSDAPQDFKNRVKQIADAKRANAEAASKAGPVPEPIRLSMSVDSQGLHDPNTILFLESAKQITPELAQQMLQAPPAPQADPSVSVEHQNAVQENQSLKLDAANKSQEMQLRATELNLKAQETAHMLQLKSEELEIKKGELALKTADTQASQAAAAKAPPAPLMDPQIVIAQMKAASEIEKAHIAAATDIHKTHLTFQQNEEKVKGEQEKASAQKNQESAKIIQAVSKAQNDLSAEVVRQGNEFGSAIQVLTKAIHAPKKITVKRNDDGKIIGAVATMEDGQS